jgi:hypothetical protein
MARTGILVIIVGDTITRTEVETGDEAFDERDEWKVESERSLFVLQGLDCSELEESWLLVQVEKPKLVCHQPPLAGLP